MLEPAVYAGACCAVKLVVMYLQHAADAVSRNITLCRLYSALGVSSCTQHFLANCLPRLVHAYLCHTRLQAVLNGKLCLLCARAWAEGNKHPSQ